MSEQDPVEREPSLHGALHAGVGLLAESTRAVADLLASAGSGARDAVPTGLMSGATRMVSSLQQLLELMPPLTRELDVLVAEVHAKRLSVQALQAELAALDDQLDVLEHSLAPVQSWSHEWKRLRASATGWLTTDSPAPDPPKRAATGQKRAAKRAGDGRHTPLSDPIAGSGTL